MLSRTIATASASALALIALSVPVVNAQADGGDAGAGSVALGSLDAGSLLEGSLDSGSAEDTSVGGLAPESDEVCELPDLGGSVAKFYPLFGISGVPSGVLDLITSALSPLPNVLDLVAGPGGGTALVGQSGSLAEPLCSSIFGGEMVLPPVTVIVDGDGNPVTTVTGTVAPSSTGESALTSASGSSSASSSTSASSPNSTSATGASSTDAPRAGSVALPTSVPAPGA